MPRLVRVSIPFLALLVAIGLTACGSSDSSADDFHAEADAVCTDQAQRFIEVERRVGTSESLEDEAKLQEELGAVRKSSLSELEELEAPDEVSDEWAEYLRIRQQLTDLRKAQLELLSKGDEKALEPLNEKISDRNDELDEIGEKAGLEACASVLPKGQAEEAEEVVEEVALTTKPQRVCDELVTENYLEINFDNSFEECAKFQRENADDFAEEVEVESVEGVADTQAAVRITEIGGMYDGEETVWILHRENGAWKVNLISTS